MDRNRNPDHLITTIDWLGDTFRDVDLLEDAYIEDGHLMVVLDGGYVFKFKRTAFPYHEDRFLALREAIEHNQNLRRKWASN